MDETIRAKVLELLAQHSLMTLATNRSDGWPQATTVGYANDGLTIYFLCSPQSQKARNIARDSRVSLTIDHDVSDVTAITGLSMAATAELVRDPAEVSKAAGLLLKKAGRLLMKRYPGHVAYPPLKPDEIVFIKVVPKVISVVDYSKGFGHADLTTV